MKVTDKNHKKKCLQSRLYPITWFLRAHEYDFASSL
ncbi:hypothetical protein SAMN04487990_1187 [Bizionia paragorgiae]|uniref:Uncharacterized protein n=1 Tax=Bizionia paragorgiae TaxID=283786 RepID=A0A1H4C4Z9_BIZPA|nr:hypothetical protein SAMN04487990_1187 [Bizionia paragorgiae]